MKALFTKFVILTILLSESLTANAYDFKVGNLYYDIVSVPDRTCALTKGDTPYSGEINIPDSVLLNGRYLKVTTIKERIFKDSEISELTIPPSVTKINGYNYGTIGKLNILFGDTPLIFDNSFGSWEVKEAYIDRVISYSENALSFGFKDNEYIEKLTIGKHLSYFSKTFANSCKNLKYLYIEDCDTPLTLNSYYDTFGSSPLTDVYIGRNINGKFYRENIEHVVLGKNVTILAEKSFQSCKRLKSIDFCNVEEIGNYAFEECDSLVTPIFPKSIRTIGKYGFQNCESITEVIVGGNIDNIGDGAFYSCGSLKKVQLNGAVKSIGNSAFGNCEKIDTIILGEGVEFIKGYAFSEAKITDMIIPNSVRQLGIGAFWYCKNLKKLMIGTNLTQIEEYAFEKSELDSIIIKATLPPIIKGSTFSSRSYLNCVVTVPAESVNAYMSDNVWKNFWNIKAAGIESVTSDDDSIAVSANDGDISVLNKGERDVVQVYSIQGTLLAETTESKITNLPIGLYIVTVGAKSFKISLQ